MSAPSSWPHLNLITSQTSHFLMLKSYWGLGLQHYAFWKGTNIQPISETLNEKLNPRESVQNHNMKHGTLHVNDMLFKLL